MAPRVGPVLLAEFIARRADFLDFLKPRRRLSVAAVALIRHVGPGPAPIHPDAVRVRSRTVHAWRSLAAPAALLAALTGAAWSASAGAASSIQPGYWSYQASTLITGAKSGIQCVRPDKIDEFLSGPHNRHYRCTYPVREVADGAATFIGECVSKGGNRYRITLKGHYGPTAFELSGNVAGTFVGLPISVPIEIKAHQVSADCPAGAK